MNPDSQETIAKLLLAGALGGGGLAAIQNMAKHQQMLQEQAAHFDKLEQPDEEELAKVSRAASTGYLRTKLASGRVLPAATGVVGGVAASMASYALVNRLAKQLRAKELQRMLVDAEEGYNEALLREAEASRAKRANVGGYTPTELSLIMLASSLPLAGLASGVFTNRLLKKTFDPAPSQSPSDINPDSLVAVRRKRQQDDNTKKAYAPGSFTDEDEALCRLVGVVSAFEKASWLRGLIKAVGNGNGPELEKLAMQRGFPAVLDATTSSCSLPIDDPTFAVACIRTVKTAAWRAPLELLVAAEMVEHAPGQVKLASTLLERDQELLLENFVLGGRLAKAAALGAFEGEGSSDLPDSDSKLLHVLDACLKQANADTPARSPGIPMYDSDSGAPSADSDPEENTEIPDALAQPPTDVIDKVLGQKPKVLPPVS